VGGTKGVGKKRGVGFLWGEEEKIKNDRKGGGHLGLGRESFRIGLTALLAGPEG